MRPNPKTYLQKKYVLFFFSFLLKYLNDEKKIVRNLVKIFITHILAMFSLFHFQNKITITNNKTHVKIVYVHCNVRGDWKGWSYATFYRLCNVSLCVYLCKLLFRKKKKKYFINTYLYVHLYYNISVYTNAVLPLTIDFLHNSFLCFAFPPIENTLLVNSLFR